ncbi:2,3-dihydro-2,3-dihydroxybenzoate dehydrogenase [Amycolatopsis endophytica]|uniref:2,3-dihydro-2,3-dihydroxybenzoate dehydrogenase n=1 Tax=Amycolatopsis endophytica TaxID=860233 RepID=A0A853BDL3_9PSEU|nr:2,3-dihydro-2,3-dihydroxybenzoate dehydrogenase [Amycolatopsis endophytica]NYI92536.1 2,3-dihydro-2,3-dihydroxybenzoate dehydrogenase [Amycolatopsis endophytica]
MTKQGSADEGVVLVTGAAQGIGAAVVRAFAETGRRVVAADVREETLEGEVAKCAAGGLDVRACAVDVTDAAAVETAVSEVESRHGPVSVLVNGAGVLRTGEVTAMPDADWQDVFAVNTTGVFLVSRAVARRMVPRGAGSIVTISSNAGGVPRVGMAAYAASKAAATMFTKSLGLELARHGIRCNVVAPGSTATPMLAGMGVSEADLIAGSPATYKVGIPLNKVARPADVADAVLYLASPAAGHVTLQELYVDGGATLGGKA